MNVSQIVAEYLIGLAEETGDNTMEIQKVLTLIAVRQQPEIQMIDLPRYTMVERSANSRNVAKLGQGESPDKPGAGLVEAYEDPHNRRFKRVRLTGRGRAVMETVERRALRSLPRGRPDSQWGD